MSDQIATLGQLLDGAGTQWRAFDIGRHITKLDKQQFLAIEQAQVPYPYPLAGHAWLAIQFWDAKASKEPYVWFLKFPLDEQSKLVSASRDHFADMVIQALGTEITGEKADGKLDNNPYVFTPNANKLAAFNAQVKVLLKQPASQYYEYAQLYFSAKLGFDNWQSVALQGIADFAASLHQDSFKKLLLTQFLTLATDMQYALCTSFENHQIDKDISQLLINWYQQDVKDEKRLHCVIRGLCQSQAQTEVEKLLSSILKHTQGKSDATLMLIAARQWQHLQQPEILKLYIELLANSENDLFIGLFPDLVQIPMLREIMLNVLRWPEKSPKLTHSIGQLFGQNA